MHYFFGSKMTHLTQQPSIVLEKPLIHIPFGPFYHDESKKSS